MRTHGIKTRRTNTDTQQALLTGIAIAVVATLGLWLAGCVPEVTKNSVPCPDDLCPSTVTSPIHFAYAVNSGDNTISQFTIDESTGLIRPNGYVSSVVAAPTTILAHPSGKFVYVGTNTQIQPFAVDATTGALTAAGSSIAGVSSALDPVGQHLYVVTNSPTFVGAYQIQSDGSLNFISQVSTGATVSNRVVVHPSGKYVYVMNGTDPRTVNGAGSVSHYTVQSDGTLVALIDPATTKPFFDPGTSDALTGVVVDPLGRHLSFTGSLARLFTWKINQAIGTFVFSYDINMSFGVTEVELNPTAQVLYVPRTGGNDIQTQKVDLTFPTVVAANPVGANASISSPQNLQFDAATSYLYITSTSGTAQNTVTAFAVNSDGSIGTATSAIRTRATPKGFTKTPPQRSVSYAPKFAYVANGSAGNVSAYAINAATGGLSSVGPAVAAGTTPFSVSVDPQSRYAYVANKGSNNVSGYTVNPSSGALTSIGAPIAAGTTPQAIVTDPSGTYVYVANNGSNNVSGYRINAGGALTSLGAPIAAGTLPWGIAADPTGRFVYVVNDGSNNASAYSIGASGTLTAIGAPVATGSNPQAVVVDPTGRYAFVANTGADSVQAYSITSVTGALNSVGTQPTGNQPGSIAVDPTGNFVYVGNLGTSDVSAFRINQATGALTSIGPTVPAGGNPYSISVDTTGRYVYVANTLSNTLTVYSIDPATGALTPMPGLQTANSGAPQSISILGGLQ